MILFQRTKYKRAVSNIDRINGLIANGELRPVGAVMRNVARYSEDKRDVLALNLKAYFAIAAFAVFFAKLVL